MTTYRIDQRAGHKNFRTLCVPCHKRETRGAPRARRRRQPRLPGVGA